MSYIFSLAFMVNMLSMTAMLILFSMAGQSHMAADLGIAQAATAALFSAFSANARNLVLATTNPSLASSIFNIRVILLVPLVLSSFWLSSTLGGIEPVFAAILILRRTVEWFGEVDLSEKERLGDKNFALTYVLIQAILFVFSALWTLMRMPYPLLSLFLWALMPMLLSIKFVLSALGDFANALSGMNKRMAPHFGSTLAIGVSLYVFRLLLILILGKSVSGDLFAAFAIGGVLGSLTLNTFGPNIAFNEKVSGICKFPPMLTFILWIFLGVGLFILGISYLNPSLFLWAGKEIFYWKAIGFSMIGGVVMTHAQLLRNRLLIHNENYDLFGPDLLMNILIIAAVPLAYFTIGTDAVAGLSLVGALLAMVFYKSSERTEIADNDKLILTYIPNLLAMAVLMPVFIRLSSGVFLDKAPLLAGGTSLLDLPVSLSIFLTYVAILMIGSYRTVHLSLSVVFFTFIFMIFSTLIVSTSHGDWERSKIVLVIQCILPMGALVLGEMFKDEGLDIDARIERSFLLVLALLVPLQLAASWMQGSLQLVSYVYIFSIYQHIHYVPIIIVSAYLLVIFTLWQDCTYKNTLLVLTPIMGVYVAASLSIIVIIFFILGVFVFAIQRWHFASDKLPTSIFFITLLVCLGYLSVEVSTMTIAGKFSTIAIDTMSAWQLYMNEIFSNKKTIFLGHADALDMTMFSSVHNYYLDMVRNFGLVAVAPLLIVLAYTMREVYFCRKNIIVNFALLGHVFVLFFLLLIDNSIQVSLRQPYSGVFIFFIWGLLIARLDKINTIQGG